MNAAADDDVVFEIRMERDTFRQLRTAMTVRAMSSANAGLIEAFVLKFLDQVDAGAKTYYFKRKTSND